MYPPAHSSPWMKLLQLLLVPLLLLSIAPSIPAVDSKSNGSKEEVRWQILTKLNFSSQIRLHPHILLMVTVPWSGESRSLMKELADGISRKQKEFSTLKLMLIYRNNDRMLADALGASVRIAIIHYHYSLSYKYQGRLRVQNILSSAHYLRSFLPEKSPLKSLSTPEDLKEFLNSTDKALLLLEFCGWTPKLMEKAKNNGSEYVFGFNGEINESRAANGKENLKRMEKEKMNCAVDSGFTGIPWLGEYTTMNESDFVEAENMRSSDGISCTFEEFQQFESFLPQFLTVVREFFLPPERLKFGIVPERSLLSSLGVQDSGSWLKMLYFAGCPGCSIILREDDELKRFLEINAVPVTELKSDDEPALPANRPSILLFIDRSSESFYTRRNSKDALDAFRELALHNQMPDKMSAQNSAKPQKSFGEAQISKIMSGHYPLEPSTLSRKTTAVKNKMSMMITNEGKRVNLDKVASDLQGSSLHEILQYVLQHKEIKLSSLAKDVGFQLLSDDFGIKIAETLPAKTEVQLEQVSAELPIEDLLESNVGPEKVQVQHVPALFNGEREKLSKPINVEYTVYHDEKSSFDTRLQLPNHYQGKQVVASTADGKEEEETLSEIENGSQELDLTGFNGSFFFYDGEFRLLQALTSVSKIPSLVIIDPLSQQHYVLHEEAAFSYSSLSSFLHMFLNGSLLPYQISESVCVDEQKAPLPPFVNLDFHEADSIPRVTTNTFFNLVIGNQSSSLHAGNAWKKDVLVLFSNSWCGFCQRMELVVREVYRAFKGYGNMMKSGSGDKKSSLRSDDVINTELKLPLIYMMDCTQNNCSLIRKSMIQRDLYPSLLLFPAERKKAISYEGDMSVLDIIKFIADHSSDCQWLFMERGMLWTEVEQGTRNKKLYSDVSQVVLYEEASLVKGRHHEVLVKDRAQNVALRSNKISPQTPNGSGGTALPVVPGSILTATDKLLNVHPFDRSKILILKVNRSMGFQGLIINKHIHWDSLQELEKGLELLREAPLSFGGLIVIRGMPLVALTRESIKDQHLEVLPDIYFLDQQDTLNVIEGLKLGNRSITHYWFFLGYTSWGWDQLFDEIAEGAWGVSNGNVEQLDWPGA